MREESRIFYEYPLIPLGMGAENEQRSKLVACYRAGDERTETEDLKFACLLCWSTCFSVRPDRLVGSQRKLMELGTALRG